MATPIYKSKLEKSGKEKWHKILVQSKILKNRSFQVIFEVRKSAPRERFWVGLDDVLAHGGHCPSDGLLYKSIGTDEETDVDLLTPLENLINTDPRVYRTKGLDGLPAVGIQRGVEIVVPYRIYLPRKFYPNFAILASIKPKDNQGGYLFAVVNAFDTVVDLGVLLTPAGRSQTNISLVYTDSQAQSTSSVIASFLVPAFTNQWTQFALEVSGENVALYFRCARFATRQVRRQPMQLQMDDASKLYIANAGPIIAGGFEGAIQELKLHDDPAEAENQCNEDWWKGKRKNQQVKGTEASGFDEGFDATTRAPIRTTTPEEDNRIDGDDDEDRGQSIGIGVQPPTTPQPYRSSQTQSQLSTPEYVRGPKGDKGDPGPPGVCPSNCADFYSIGQTTGPRYERLSDEDIARIANYPGVKGAKGDSTDNGPSRPTGSTALPPYDPRVHKYSTKGQKGEPGERGPPGIPGHSAVVSSQNTGSSLVSVYPTSTELFASHRTTPIGQLAFSVSSQELFIRVNNGWQRVKLEGFYSTVEQRPPVTAPAEEYRPPVVATLPPPPREPEIRTLAPPRRVEPPPTYHHVKPHHKDKILRLIALNNPMNGKMGGIRGADLQCYKQARQAGHTTTFRAFLSSKVQDLRHIVHYADNDTAVVNARGEKLFDSWGEIFSPNMIPKDVPIYSFNHRNIFDDSEWTDRYIWHGSDDTGRRLEQSSCQAWRSPDRYAHGMASAVMRGRPLITDGEQISCHRNLIVLCIENMSKFEVDRRLSRRMSRRKL